MRRVRALPRQLLALDLLRARARGPRRAALDGARHAAERPVPHRLARPGVRRGRGQRGGSHPQRAGRGGLRGRGHRVRPLADVQRRRFGHHRRRDRARGLPLARRAGAGGGQGGETGRAPVTAGTVTFCVVAAQTERLARFLADQLALSRTVAARLVAGRHVSAAGRPLRASARLERGAVVTVTLPPEAPPPRSYAPAHQTLTFVFEDEHLAVVDKPAGLVVHPGPGHWDDTLVNVLAGRGTPLAPGAEGRPRIVHRLDRATSGLPPVAQTEAAHPRPATLIEQPRRQRRYPP